jgi:hypothetical protein
MQEKNISFEEIGKDETARAEQSSSLFKQPIRGSFQSLYEELKARCAPENFMNPYEPVKVSKANELYSEVLKTDVYDDRKQKELRLRAIEELGVKFSTELLYEKLTKACNPKNYTGEAYNKERLELANKLYQAVMMNADNVFALEDIEEKAKKLIQKFEEKTNKQNTNSFWEDEEIFIGCLISLILTIIISISVYLML